MKSYLHTPKQEPRKHFLDVQAMGRRAEYWFSAGVMFAETHYVAHLSMSLTALLIFWGKITWFLLQDKKKKQKQVDRWAFTERKLQSCVQAKLVNLMQPAGHAGRGIVTQLFSSLFSGSKQNWQVCFRNLI